MTNTYSRACNEVLMLLRAYLSEEEYNKIPREKIEFFEKNIDVNYNYEIDKNLPLSEQKISEKANAIIVTLYRDYFLDEYQKKRLNEILQINEQKRIETNNFSNNIWDKKKENKVENRNIQKEFSITVVKKENLFTKIINKMKKFLNKYY